MVRLLIAVAALLFARAVQAQQNCGEGAVVNINTASATDAQVVTPLAGRAVYVCAIEASSAGANSFYLESSSAGTCGGNLTPIGTTYSMGANSYKPPTYAPGLKIPAGYGLCVHTTQSAALSVSVWYAQRP